MTTSPIRLCLPADADDICAIYNHYVRESIATFEEKLVPREEMAQRIRQVPAGFPWLVWQDGDSIAGYAHAAPWQTRSAYRYTVESTVYVAPGAIGRGIGRRLYGTLIAELEERGVHCVMAAIALPNPASIALHEDLGFVKTAHLAEIGWKFERWIDVGYWQLMLSNAT